MLLEAARAAQDLRCFVQISTDEVYGSVAQGSSVETDELRPRNPYSASKAGADRLAYSYWATYGVPVIITRASNNYGPYPVSGEGDPALHHQCVRQHSGAALRRRAEHPRLAARDGSLPRHRRRRSNADRPARSTTSAAATKCATSISPTCCCGSPNVPIRSSSGCRIARGTICATASTRRSFGGSAGSLQVPFEDGLKDTVRWYRDNEWWWRPIKEEDPAFRAYYQSTIRLAAVSSVLVTGARGFAGRYLVEHLRADWRRGDGLGTRSTSTCSIADAVARAIADLRPSVVYHCAGAAHVGQSFSNVADTLAANVLGTHHLLDALRQAGCQRPRPDYGLVARVSAVGPRAERRGSHRSGHALRRQQARAGDARPARHQRGRPAGVADSLVQPHGTSPGPIVRRARVRAADRADRKGAHARRRSSSAISTHRAICTTCATRFAPIATIVERGEPGEDLQRLLRRDVQDSRRARSIGRDEPRAGDGDRRSGALPAERQPHRSGAIGAASSASSAGSRKSLWIKRLPTCLTTGERR